VTARDTLPPHRASGEMGVVLVLMALLMVAMIAIVAIVIDLGQLRADRREAQKAVDLASLAAGFHLSGRGALPGDGVIGDPRAACEAVLVSVKANVPGFPADATMPCGDFPESSEAPDCTATTPMITRSSAGSGSVVLTISYPVPDSAISEERFAGGVGVNDGTDRCERMMVEMDGTRPTSFASVVGVDSQTIGGRSVVRATTPNVTEGTAALLLLEREACGALQSSGQGLVLVRSSSPSNPGVIMADSAGSVSPGGCKSTENSGGYVIYATALPASLGGGPSIIAEDAPNGTKGVISTYAGAVNPSNAAAQYPEGLSPEPRDGGITSRRPADNKYNSNAAPRVADLHERAYLATTSAAPPGATIVEGAQCSGNNPNPFEVTGAVVYVNCASFSTGNNRSVRFPDAHTIIFTGKVDIAASIVMPSARRVYIRGCDPSVSNAHCSPGNNFAVSVSGQLRINSGPDAASPASCLSRSGPGAGGNVTQTVEVATLGGPILVSGQISLCQTFVYAGKNEAMYEPQQVIDGGNCSALLPCPKVSGSGRGFIDITGGGGTADWSAPNQLEQGGPTDDQPFEDLAFWGESDLPSSIKGQGANRTEGVFFLPNSSVAFTGQATQDQPLNAQFFARMLNLSGQGDLYLMPDPSDSVQTPIPGAIGLIR
jgi:hypothetical protein